jgi:hypothetical protein
VTTKDPERTTEDGNDEADDDKALADGIHDRTLPRVGRRATADHSTIDAYGWVAQARSLTRCSSFRIFGAIT